MSEDPHGGAFAAGRTDRDRTLEALRHLEDALAGAAEEGDWPASVGRGLSGLEQAMSAERDELHRPDALLELVAEGDPRRYGPRVRNLRRMYDDVMSQVGSLRLQLADASPDPTDLRERAGWIVRALHHCRAQQTDLVYDALGLDLGRRSPP